MNQSYCYSFRFCCDPGFNDRSELESLERYVREARIDDVAVFANVQELNTCLLCTSPSPRDSTSSRMPSSA